VVVVVVLLGCYHCSTRETPRWRTGPEGKNTLCNACGLRYAKYKKTVNTNNGVILYNGIKALSL